MSHHRAENYKVVSNPNEVRLKRSNFSVKLRKEQRELALGKRRKAGNGIVASEVLEDKAVVLVPESLPLPLLNTLTSTSSSSSNSSTSNFPIPPVVNNNSHGELLPDEIVVQAINGLSNGEVRVRLSNLQQIRHYTAVPKASRQLMQLFRLGAIPPCIMLLKDQTNRDCRYEACWIINNIASGSTRFVQSLIENGVLPPLFDALHGVEDFQIHEHALWALFNIGGDGFRYALQLIEEYKFVDQLVQLATGNPHLINNIQYAQTWAWGLASFCQHKFGVKMLAGLIPILSTLLAHSDERILVEVCSAFHFLTEENTQDGDNIQIEAITSQPGVVNRLIRLLYCPECEVLRPAIRVIANIASGNRAHSDLLFREGIVDALETMFAHKNADIEFQLCYAISNLASECPEHTNQLFRFVPKIKRIAMNGKTGFRTRVETTWCFINLVLMGATERIRECILSDGEVILGLVDMLGSEEPSLLVKLMEVFGRLIEMDLEFVTRLSDTFAISKIEDLQGHNNVKVYKAAVFLSDQIVKAVEKQDEVLQTFHLHNFDSKIE